jgi:hypothetical protein
MAKKAATTRTQTVATARLRDVLVDLPAMAERFGDLILKSRAPYFSVLVPDANGTELVENEEFLNLAIRDMFLAEAEKIARVAKRRFNVTLDPGDVP